MPETSLGLIPGYGGTQRLPQLVMAAMELLLTGDMIDAQHAYEIGLANAVCSLKELDIKVREFAAAILKTHRKRNNNFWQQFVRFFHRSMAMQQKQRVLALVLKPKILDKGQRPFYIRENPNFNPRFH